MKYKEWFFEKKGFKRFLIIAMIIGAFLAVGWTRVNYDIYRLVVHEIVKAGEDTSISLTASITQSEGGYIVPWDTISSGTSASPNQLTIDSQDWQLINKTAAIPSLAVTLPQVTSALDGKVFHFKQFDSGVTPCVISPTSGVTPVDVIESTQGTLTATSDSTIDAQGDVKAWKAVYGSGTTNYWVLIEEDLS